MAAHTTRHFSSIAAASLLAVLASCGGGGEAETAGSGGAAAAESGGSITVTIDGVETTTSERLKESGVGSSTRLNVVLTADSMADPTGSPELSLGLSTGARRTGDFELVYNANKLGREGGTELATLSFELRGGERLAADDGTISISELETESGDAGGRIVRLRGTFEGGFRPRGASEQQRVSGSFDYSR